MAALTKDRNTYIRDRKRSISLKVAASTKIFAGSMVAANSSGFAVPAGDTVGHKVIGRAESFVDNSSGANGDLSVAVNKGVHKWANSGASAIAQADIGATVMVEDDQTVRKTSTNSIAAGVVDEVDADGGIWVSTPNN